MSADAIRAFIAHVEANWEHTPVAFENEGADLPVDNTALLQVHMPIARESMETTGDPGNNIYRESGAFRIRLLVPLGERPDEGPLFWLDKLDALRGALRGQTIGDLITWEAGPVLSRQSESGPYQELSFATEFQLDIYG